MSFITYQVKDFIGTLTINRPEALNALNGALISEFAQKLKEIATPDLRCLVITGAGPKSFVAGADIAEMLPLDPHGAYDYSMAGNALMDAVDDFPTPVIAAINGYALGGGFELALACDIRVAAENAAFAFPEVSIGIMPGYGGIKRSVSLLGAGRAKELLYTAKRISAQEALALGIVNSVYPAAELLSEVMKIAEKIAANAPIGVQYTKKAANYAAEITSERFSIKEAEYFKGCFGREDQRNAMTAFVEKRKPGPFTGK
jgi:enoyl-CoA hydratase